MESDEVSREQAEADLAVLRAQRSELADRMMRPTPWWFEASFAGLVFGLFASYSLDNKWISAVVVAAVLASFWALARFWAHHTGVWVDGFRRGKTWPAVAVWTVAVLVVASTGFVAEEHWRGSMVVVGAVLGVGVLLVNRWWGRLYVRELREMT